MPESAIGVDDVTTRADNSITSTMVDAVAQAITPRTAAHQELSAARKKGDYVSLRLGDPTYATPLHQRGCHYPLELYIKCSVSVSFDRWFKDAWCFGTFFARAIP